MIKRIQTAIKTKKGLRDVLYMFRSQVALQPITMAKSFVVAKFLGPEHYGILKSVELVSMLNKFGNLGFLNVVIRDASTAQAQNDEAKLVSTKNNAYTAEIIMSLFLAVAGGVASLFFEDYLIKSAIILASLGLFTAKLLNVVKVEMRVNKQFKLLSNLLLIHGYLNAILVMVTVPFYKLEAVLIVPIVSSLVVTFYTMRKLGRFFQLKMDKPGLFAVLRVGIPLTLGSLSFGLFRYTERIIIITFIGLEAMGYYGFAGTVTAAFISLLVTSVMKVRTIKIYEELGRANYQLVHRMVLKETGVLVALAFAAILVTAIGLKLLVPLFLDQWMEAIGVTILFSFVLPLKVSSLYVAAVIKSPTVNKLNFEPKIQVFGAIFMAAISLGFYFWGQLTLTYFVVINLSAYALVNLSFIYYYYVTFMKVTLANQGQN